MNIKDIQLSIANSINCLKKFENQIDSFLNIHEFSDNYSWHLSCLENVLNIENNLFLSLKQLNDLYPLKNFSQCESFHLRSCNLKNNLEQPTSLNVSSELNADLLFLKQWILNQFPNVKEEVNSLVSVYSSLLKRKISKDLLKSEVSYLFHGLKKDRAHEILQRGSILGYTHQKYWKDGKRRKDNDSTYDQYMLMKGISMSRDLNYALSWSDVVLVFDKKIIEQSHPIEPYAWNYTFNHQAHVKKEREEFVVLNKTGRKFKNSENEEWMKDYNSIMNEDTSDMNEDDKLAYEEFKKDLSKELDLNHVKDLSQPYGEFDFQSSGALVGIVLKSYIMEIFGKDDFSLDFIVNHPLFWGILED